jgi:hypothetical protein
MVSLPKVSGELIRLAAIALNRRPAPAPPPDPPFKEALAHVCRIFAAEEENARRHSQTGSVLVTATIAFLAAGLFRFGLDLFTPAVNDNEPLWVGYAVRGLMILGLGLLWRSSYWMFGGPHGERRAVKRVLARRSQHLLASSTLLFPEEDDLAGLKEPEEGTAEWVRYRSYLRTLGAAKDLTDHNVRRDVEIFLSRRAFLGGLGCIALGVALMVGWYNPGGGRKGSPHAPGSSAAAQQQPGSASAAGAPPAPQPRRGPRAGAGVLAKAPQPAAAAPAAPVGQPPPAAP